jgi:hypothetical protein
MDRADCKNRQSVLRDWMSVSWRLSSMMEGVCRVLMTWGSIVSS